MKRQDRPAREPRTLAQQLAPGQTIECMRCGPGRPADGAVKFQALMVCAACARTVGVSKAPRA